MTNKLFNLVYLPAIFGFLILSVVFGFAQSAPTDTWELIKEKGDLKVYTRKNINSNIKEIRITTLVRAPMEDFIDALNDADSYKLWVYRCSFSTLVEKPSSSELYYHTATDFPFPFSDRDLVVYTSQRFDEHGVFFSDSYARPDHLPMVEDVVRIFYFESHWKVTALDDGTLHIDYNSKVDPAGNIPQWIVNLGLTVGPVKSMEKFTEFVEKGRFVKK